MLIYMSTNDAPDFVVNIYNPSFFADDSGTGLTTAQATALFLSKSSPDTATALTTFTAGIATNDIDTTSLSSNLDIGSSSNTGTLAIDTQGNTTIAASQVGGTLAIGGATTRTGAITIGSGGTAILPITIGSTAATASVSIRNPQMTMSYTTQPTLTTAQIGYTNSVYLNTVGGNSVTLTGGAITALSIASVPIGIWLVSYGTRITATSTTLTTNVTLYQTHINVNNQTGSFPYAYGPSGFGTLSMPVGTYTDGISKSIATSGAAIINVKIAATISLVYYATATASISFWNNGTPVNPSTYLTITRVG